MLLCEASSSFRRRTAGWIVSRFSQPLAWSYFGWDDQCGEKGHIGQGFGRLGFDLWKLWSWPLLSYHTEKRSTLPVGGAWKLVLGWWGCVGFCHPLTRPTRKFCTIDTWAHCWIREPEPRFRKIAVLHAHVGGPHKRLSMRPGVTKPTWWDAYLNRDMNGVDCMHLEQLSGKQSQSWTRRHTGTRGSQPVNKHHVMKNACKLRWNWIFLLSIDWKNWKKQQLTKVLQIPCEEVFGPPKGLVRRYLED